MLTALELFEKLNQTDECNFIEAKKASEIGKSILETVCSFSNEPNLGGGYLLLGVEKEESSDSLFPQYIVTGIPQNNLDKIQADLSSQCNDQFNRPVRPIVSVETIKNKSVIVLYVEELPIGQKPLYFSNRGLPQGAYRRIGSVDVKGTEDDLQIYYDSKDSFDSSIVTDAELEDLSDESIKLYRKYRAAINSSAEELVYSDIDLLRAIHAIKKKKSEIFITYAGLLTFGSKLALRRLLPMVRVDYIRVSTNDWVSRADERFSSTIDMRGSLLELVQRIIHTIADDLPKGFELSDDNIQAKNIGMPLRVLREAVVNALIHRSYRENSPIQIIRYPNRIEISNPGFSLKNEEHLGEPGSVNRNPYIAAIFHETNLAETKGSGIKTIRILMQEAGMMAPTFESDREKNKFTIRLLLHHLLDEKDIDWLASFEHYQLTDNQKRILIFIREVGAIDNSVTRQINGYESSNANYDLRRLKELELLEAKGKSRYTYYLPTSKLFELKGGNPDSISGSDVESEGYLPSLSTNLPSLPTKLKELPIRPDVLNEEKIEKLLSLRQEIDGLSSRIENKEIISNLILELCKIQEFKKEELAVWLHRNEKYIYNDYIKPLLEAGKLKYLYPDMVNHPEQAYKTAKEIKR